MSPSALLRGKRTVPGGSTLFWQGRTSTVICRRQRPSSTTRGMPTPAGTFSSTKVPSALVMKLAIELSGVFGTQRSQLGAVGSVNGGSLVPSGMLGM
jgi:hypothetical protein